MTDFLLELRSEEIPARMQDRARADLERLFAAELTKAGIAADAIVTYATPRRLALIARDLPDATEATREEVKGPRTSAPEQALEGFLRKTGLSKEQLTTRDGVWFAVSERPGRATADVLAAAIPAIVRGFPWPKSMRWGDASLSSESPRWVRPLQGIVAILGEELVSCEVAGVASGYATVGHRFHSPHALTIGGAHDYVEKLRLAHVIVDQDERRTLIRNRATTLAADAGLALVEDEGLVAENAGLTEWPVPLLGRFDEAFLEVPAEVIQLTARVNQKYFVCEKDGALANAFVCVANIDAKDGGKRIIAGNQKVLAARLSDARFFYDTDLKVPLKQQGQKLAKIVFHEKLGTVADKVERVAKLARWLVEEGIVPPRAPANAGALADGARADPTLLRSQEHERARLADMAERAARLAKADLVTGMVGEFPELQGLMGGYYAKAQGEPREVWEAVRDHYKPVGQGDDVPTAPVTVAVSLADKLDTIAAFFSIREKPTGSKDPFALRRAVLGVIALVLEGELRLSLRDAAYYAALLRVELAEVSNVQALHTPEAIAAVAGGDAKGFLLNVQCDPNFVYEEFPSFLADRLKVQQREAGVRHDLIDAVFALGGEDDLVRLLARVKALQSFVTTGEGANLLAGYKRAANILKKEGWDTTAPTSVIPAQAGIDSRDDAALAEPVEDIDARLRGDDDEGAADEAGATYAADEPFGDESTDRHPDERASQAIDAQTSDDTIPMTGEEDPLVEVDQHGFAPVAGAFARCEAANAPSYVPEPAEQALIDALEAAEPRAAAAVEAEDFEGAMAALASLRGPVDAFFDTVTVNDADPAKRAARLALLARMRDAVHRVADFGRIEG